MAVYFIRNTRCGSIKIGTSNDPASRLRSLQTASPAKLEMLATIPGGPEVESHLHETFKRDRLEGEWFEPSRRLHATIRDLAEYGPCVPSLFGRPLRSVYLAGRISDTDWRNEVMPRWSGYAALDDTERGWNAVVGGVPVPGSPVRALDYLGPFYFDMTGHCSRRGAHGYGEENFNGATHCTDYETDGERVARACRDAIRRADLVFAWLDSDDAHGTLAEIGLAIGCGCLTVVAGPEGKASASWLARCCADAVVVAGSPGEAWRRLWGDDPDEVFEPGETVTVAGHWYDEDETIECADFFYCWTCNGWEIPGYGQKCRRCSGLLTCGSCGLTSEGCRCGQAERVAAFNADERARART